MAGMPQTMPLGRGNPMSSMNSMSSGSSSSSPRQSMYAPPSLSSSGHSLLSPGSHPPQMFAPGYQQIPGQYSGRPMSHQSPKMQSRTPYMASPTPISPPPSMPMAYGPPMPNPGPRPQAANAYQMPPKKGTLAPGEQVQVGSETVIVEKYLSEGGYAHVYLTRSAKSDGIAGHRAQCLKRIAVRDDQGSAIMREVEHEIDVMKKLRGNSWIVEYLASSARRIERNMPGGPGWEVFILMEFCAGGGIIDLLNKRLQNRLREDEILSIFVDICEAVAYMHSLPQPLLHRDLKIENILCHPIDERHSKDSADISSFRYKLCDFGSTTFPSNRPARTKKEIDEQQMDLGRHTTLQYRSPEMVEPLLGLPVGLPADVWALGVLLYKLCYYTTPFEEHGPLAIVNAKYTFPGFPGYSPAVQHLIASMLVEHPAKRPTVFDVLRQVHKMRGSQPSRDYVSRTTSAPSANIHRADSSNILDFTSKTDKAAPNNFAPSLPDIQPQRRGRPVRGGQEIGMADGAKHHNGNQLIAPQVTESKRHSITQKPSNAARGNDVRSQISRGVKELKDGFADTFSATEAKAAAPGPPDLLDSIGSDDGFGIVSPGAKVQGPVAETGIMKSPISATGSGFGDNFGDLRSSPIGGTVAEPHETVGSPRKETRRVSSPGADESFETRFPSIEELMRDSGLKQGIRTAALENAENTSSRPMHLHPNVTGDNASADVSRPRRESFARDGHVFPRSTHVTGTAFKDAQNERPDDAKSSPTNDLDERTSPENSSARPSLPTDLKREEEAVTPNTSWPADLLTGDLDQDHSIKVAEVLKPHQLPPSSTFAQYREQFEKTGKSVRQKSLSVPPKPAHLSRAAQTTSESPGLSNEDKRETINSKAADATQTQPSEEGKRDRVKVPPPVAPKSDILHGRPSGPIQVETAAKPLQRGNSTQSRDSDLPDFLDSPTGTPSNMGSPTAQTKSADPTSKSAESDGDGEVGEISGQVSGLGLDGGAARANSLKVKPPLAPKPAKGVSEALRPSEPLRSDGKRPPPLGRKPSLAAKSQPESQAEQDDAKPKSIHSLIAQWNQQGSSPPKPMEKPKGNDMLPLGTRRRI